MAIGSIINLGGGGGSSSDGKVRFICHTDYLVQGDVIRVRSLTDSSVHFEQAVQTVGDFIFFDIPCKDFYRVCLVQEINDEEVEVCAVDYYVSYGECIGVNVLNKTMLGGIQGILNAHQEANVLEVGDEVTISVDNGDTAIVQLLGYNTYGDHEAHFILKQSRSSVVAYPSTQYYLPYTSLTLRTSVQSFYNAIDEVDRRFIKQVERYSYKYGAGGYAKYSDYIWLPTDKEVSDVYPGGGSAGAPTVPQYQFPLFVSANNRIRTNTSGNSVNWWTSDGWLGTNGNGWDYCSTSGGIVTQVYTNGASIFPCFTLKADS